MTQSRGWEGHKEGGWKGGGEGEIALFVVSVCVCLSDVVLLPVCSLCVLCFRRSFHFVEEPALFVAYSYVTAAAKVSLCLLSACAAGHLNTIPF